MIIITKISKEDIKKLVDNGILKNTHKGYVNKKGEPVGHYKTCGNKIYIEDYYKNLAQNLDNIAT